MVEQEKREAKYREMEKASKFEAKSREADRKVTIER